MINSISCSVYIGDDLDVVFSCNAKNGYYFILDARLNK